MNLLHQGNKCKSFKTFIACTLIADFNTSGNNGYKTTGYDIMNKH